MDLAKDLRLDPAKEYIVYEYWSKQLDWDVPGQIRYASAQSIRLRHLQHRRETGHPVLISTSRHVRQMAFDIKDLAYDSRLRVLRGTSRAVAGDPYQLRVYVPEGFTARSAELTGNIPTTMKTEGPLLIVDFVAPNGDDIDWKILLLNCRYYCY